MADKKTDVQNDKNDKASDRGGPGGSDKGGSDKGSSDKGGSDKGGHRSASSNDDKGDMTANAGDAKASSDRDDRGAGDEKKSPEPASEPSAAETEAAVKSVPAPEGATNGEARPMREHLLDPREIDVAGDPNAKAPPPAMAPPGDSRSLRRESEFCLIYRHKQFLVRREGKLGTVGQWSVVEYPSMSAAAHAYAQECSDLASAGFTDVRG